MGYREDKLEKEEKEADELWKKTYETAEQPLAEAKPEEIAKTEGLNPEEVKVDEVETKPPEGETIETQPTETKEVKEQPKEEDWKQKYLTLEGKYRTEIPRLNSEISQWKEYTTSLSQQIKEFEAKLANLPKKELEPDKDIEALEESYPDFAKVIKRMNEQHQAEINALKEKLETGVNADIKNIKEDFNLSRQERFELDMATLAGNDWLAVNVDPNFISWLGESVPYTKFTKLQLLQDAGNRFDAKTASQFFLDYKATLTQPEAEPQPPANNLEKFTSPPRSTGASAPKSVAGVGLTKAQYEKFMNPRYKFNPSDWGGKTEIQVEALFDAAIKKGLIY